MNGFTANWLEASVAPKRTRRKAALLAPALRDGWEDSILQALPPSPLQ